MLVRVPGRERGRPILFSAHMDVVDARPEDWERSPFTLLEENGVFYGRGTTDNKAGVAALMSTILRLHVGADASGARSRLRVRRRRRNGHVDDEAHRGRIRG